MFHVKQGRDVSRETVGEMFHVKRSREGGDVSRETKEGGVPESGGGLPSLPPAALAFSLPFCPHPPCPPSRGKGEIFGFLMQGAPPLASPGLNPGGAGLPGGLAPPAPPAAKPGRHWLFSAMSVLFAPIPPAPLPGGKGETKVILCKGLRPLHPWGLSPGGIGFFAASVFFAPIPPTPFPAGRGRFLFYFAGGASPRHPCAKPARRWLAGRLRPGTSATEPGQH